MNSWKSRPLMRRSTLLPILWRWNRGKIVMPKGAPRTVELLNKKGIEVIELDLEEIKKGGGSVHCLTAFLKRDDIPVYEVERGLDMLIGGFYSVDGGLLCAEPTGRGL